MDCQSYGVIDCNPPSSLHSTYAISRGATIAGRVNNVTCTGIRWNGVDYELNIPVLRSEQDFVNALQTNIQQRFNECLELRVTSNLQSNGYAIAMTAYPVPAGSLGRLSFVAGVQRVGGYVFHLDFFESLSPFDLGPDVVVAERQQCKEWNHSLLTEIPKGPTFAFFLGVLNSQFINYNFPPREPIFDWRTKQFFPAKIAQLLKQYYQTVFGICPDITLGYSYNPAVDKAALAVSFGRQPICPVCTGRYLTIMADNTSETTTMTFYTSPVNAVPWNSGLSIGVYPCISQTFNTPGGGNAAGSPGLEP